MRKVVLITMIFIGFFAQQIFCLQSAKADSEVVCSYNSDRTKLYISPSGEVYCVKYVSATLLKPQASSIIYRLENGRAYEVLHFDQQFAEIVSVDTRQYIVNLESFAFPLLCSDPYMSTLTWIDKESKSVIKELEFEADSDKRNSFFITHGQLFHRIWDEEKEGSSLATIDENGKEELILDETGDRIYDFPSSLFLTRFTDGDQSELVLYDPTIKSMEPIKDSKLNHLIDESYLHDFIAKNNKYYFVRDGSLFYTFSDDKNSVEYCISPFQNNLETDFFYLAGEQLYVVSNHTIYTCCTSDYTWENIYTIPEFQENSIIRFAIQGNDLYIYVSEWYHSRLNYALYFCDMSQNGMLEKLMDN